MKKTFKEVIDCFVTGADVSTLTDDMIKTVVNNFREFWDYFDCYFGCDYDDYDDDYDDENDDYDENENNIDKVMKAWEKMQVYFLSLALEGKAPVDVLIMFEDEDWHGLLNTLQEIIEEKQRAE